MNPLVKLIKNEEALFNLAVDSFSTIKESPSYKLKVTRCPVCGKVITEMSEVKYYMNYGECYSHDVEDK